MDEGRIRSKRRKWWVWMAALLLSLVLLRSFIIDVYRVGGDAMSPSYKAGQILFVFKLAVIEPQDIVLYRNPSDAKQSMHLIGRIQARPADRFYATGGDFYLNGLPVAMDRETHDGYAAQGTPRYELYLPCKGDSIQLNSSNLLTYRSAISTEQGSGASFAGGTLFIGGKAQTSYRFGRNYYWILSDKATSGPDSRHLGPIAQQHIIGLVIGSL